MELIMPVMEPVKIRTKGKSWPARLWIGITSTREWRLTEDWLHTLPDGTVIIIPAGFIFDGASIPRPLWTVISPVGLLFIAALIHDFAYRYDYLWALRESGGGDSTKPYRWGFQSGRAYWDSLFIQVARAANDSSVADRAVWLNLRLFGWIAWGQHRRILHPDIHPSSLGPA